MDRTEDRYFAAGVIATWLTVFGAVIARTGLTLFTY